MLLHREAYSFDFEAIATKASARNIWMEINSSPERLDLNAAMVRHARRLGCRFTISTDAHQPRHLNNMRYGVVTARRGWLEASDVMNTLPFAELMTRLGRD